MKRSLNLKTACIIFTQVSFGYNSNKIEGTKLTEEQTSQIYETHTINTSEDSIKTDDILEMINHFRLFDYMLDNMDKTIDKEMILTMHKILKSSTSDSFNPDYNVGGFKVKPNIIGIINVIHTSSPEDVENDLDELLNKYNSIDNKTINDLIDFHYKFETIHPLSVGNGRVGRMLLFKECLNNDIVPFVILDKHRQFYINGLKNYKNDKAYLIDTCLNDQDIYDEICKKLDVYKDEKKD